MNVIKRVKHFVQRGFRGYSDEDLWNLHGYLARVISNSVKELKETQHGCPARFVLMDYKTGEILSEKPELWDQVADVIVGGFRLEERLADGDLVELTVNQEHLVDAAWEFLREYFRDLWD